MASAQLNNLSPDQKTLVARIVWKVFKAEKDHFHIKIGGLFSFDVSGLVAGWITSQFGPEPLDENSSDESSVSMS